MRFLGVRYTERAPANDALRFMTDLPKRIIGLQGRVPAVTFHM